jgi:dolichol-phosphate mannosyltransferase
MLEDRAVGANADRPASPLPRGPRCVVVVPTYDEATGIHGFLDQLLQATATDPTGGCEGDLTVEVLVVDDNSPDGTADVVRSHPAFGERLRLLSRAGKDGLGAAYRAGFAAVVGPELDPPYDVVVQMDADGSHPVAEVLSMIAALADADVVVGSRYVAGGATRGWPLSRRLLSRAANCYARTVLRLRTRDATAGFRAWRTDAIRAAGVLGTTSNGYGFQVENTWRAERCGLRVVEHPIEFTERTTGVSKMSPEVAREALTLVARWRVAELTGFGAAADTADAGGIPYADAGGTSSAGAPGPRRRVLASR